MAKSQIRAIVGSCITPSVVAGEIAIPSFAASDGEVKSGEGSEAASSISELEIRREQRSVKCAGFGDFPEREKRSQYRTATCPSVSETTSRRRTSGFQVSPGRVS